MDEMACMEEGKGVSEAQSILSEKRADPSQSVKKKKGGKKYLRDFK